MILNNFNNFLLLGYTTKYIKTNITKLRILFFIIKRCIYF